MAKATAHVKSVTDDRKAEYSSDIAAERIRALINSRPYTPSIDEMAAIIADVQTEMAEAAMWPANALETEIRETIAAWREALLIDDLSGDAIVEGLEAKVLTLATQLPDRATTVAQVISRAELAWMWADKDPHTDKLAWLEDDCGVDEVATAHLIVAVLQFAGLGRRYKVEN